MTKQILGIKIDNVDKSKLIDLFDLFSNSNKFNQLTTVNPEFLVDAQNNSEFSKVLNQSDLNVIDGFGLQMAYLLKYKIFPARIPGVDLVDLLLTFCQSNGLSVFLLGAFAETIQKLKFEISKKYPNLNFQALSGGKIEKKNQTWEQDVNILKEINIFKPTILLVALGHPKQEIWLADHKNYLPSVKIAIGVGGTFDYLSKQVKRAPLLYRRFGLEWLYRLYQQPWRWRRIYKAVVTFSYLFLLNYVKTNGKN